MKFPQHVTGYGGLPEEEPEMKNHCVIGRTGYNRTWEDEAGAIAHAQRLLAKQGIKDGQKLFIVKIVKVVELTPPPTTVRDLVATDLEN